MPAPAPTVTITSANYIKAAKIMIVTVQATGVEGNAATVKIEVQGLDNEAAGKAEKTDNG